MAERLTERFNGVLVKKGNVSRVQVFTKLGKLEDILEKYGVESLDTLEHIIKKGQLINSTIEGFAKEAYSEIQTDRDTWKRACELACDVILRFTDGCPCKADYFYQQAKKDGEQK